MTTIFFEFVSDISYKFDKYNENNYEGKNTVKRGNKLDFDSFNNDIIDKTFQSNLYKHTKKLTIKIIKYKKYKKNKKNKRISDLIINLYII